jgi:hypothetical protein
MILSCIKRRPGFWIHSNGSLGEVEAFIAGFQSALHHPGSNPKWFAHFTNWVGVHYRIIPGPRNGFSLIRDHVGEDEKLAFREFFRLLPDYIRDMRDLGPEGMDEKLAKAFEPLRSEWQSRFRQKLQASQSPSAPAKAGSNRPKRKMKRKGKG